MQLPDRINIWELSGSSAPDGAPGGNAAAAVRGATLRGATGAKDAKGGGPDMHYRMRKEKIYTTTQCNQLLVVANHVVIAQVSYQPDITIELTRRQP